MNLKLSNEQNNYKMNDKDKIYESYKCDNLGSERKTWYDSGQIKLHEIWINESDEKIFYELKSWYENGQIRKHLCYKNNKRNGEHKLWHENGQLEYYVVYKNSKRCGEVKRWHSNGICMLYVFYQDDEIEGEMKQWKDDGQLWIYQYWINDTIVDYEFSVWKKFLLLELKRKLYLKVCNKKYGLILDEKLLLDLSKIVADYM